MRAIANLCPHSCICSNSSSFTSRRNHLTCYHKAEESRHHAAVTRPRGQTGFSRSGSASGQLLLSWAAGRGIFRARASSSLGGARCVQPLKLRPKSDQRAHLTWRALKLYWEIRILFRWVCRLSLSAGSPHEPFPPLQKKSEKMLGLPSTTRRDRDKSGFFSPQRESCGLT